MTEITRITALAQFNKLNNMFTMVLGTVPDMSLLNHDYYLYKEIEIDIDNETVVGTYDNFSIVNIHEQPLEINEDMLNELARNKIVKEYPIEKQLTIIGNTIERLADAAGVDSTDIKIMNDYINEIKRANAIRKQFYANSTEYNYKSTEELDEMIATKYEGSIQAYEGQFSDL